MPGKDGHCASPLKAFPPARPARDSAISPLNSISPLKWRTAQTEFGRIEGNALPREKTVYGCHCYRPQSPDCDRLPVWNAIHLEASPVSGESGSGTRKCRAEYSCGVIGCTIRHCPRASWSLSTPRAVSTTSAPASASSTGPGLFEFEFIDLAGAIAPEPSPAFSSPKNLQTGQ